MPKKCPHCGLDCHMNAREEWMCVEHGLLEQKDLEEENKERGYIG